MLVASAILVMMGAVLVSVTDTAGKVYGLAQSQNDYRLRARAVLNYIGQDLKHASLAVNQAAAVTSSPQLPTLEFLIDPAGYNYPNSIFWQAPIATDGGSLGNMAEVGYFVRWTGGVANLCRYFVNPTTTTTSGGTTTITANSDYLIYSSGSEQGQWLAGGSGDGGLDEVAPADNAGNPPHHYQGLFLENVLGLWVQAYGYKADGVTPLPFTLPYDSSNSSGQPPPLPSHPLPAYVIISIAVLDAPSARRLQALSGLSGSAVTPASLITPYITPGAYPNAESAVEAMRANTDPKMISIRNGLSAATLTVNLDNYR